VYYIVVGLCIWLGWGGRVGWGWSYISFLKGVQLRIRKSAGRSQNITKQNAFTFCLGLRVNFQIVVTFGFKLVG